MHRDKAIEEIQQALVMNCSHGRKIPCTSADGHEAEATALFNRIKPEFDEEAVRNILGEIFSPGRSGEDSLPFAETLADLRRLWDGEEEPAQKAPAPRIFSGDQSRSMWKEINGAKTIADLRGALYTVCCRLQDFEARGPA